MGKFFDDDEKFTEEFWKLRAEFWAAPEQRPVLEALEVAQAAFAWADAEAQKIKEKARTLSMESFLSSVGLVDPLVVLSLIGITDDETRELVAEKLRREESDAARIKKSIGKLNAEKAFAIDHARAIAAELWAVDAKQQCRLNDMADKVWARMIEDGFREALPDTAKRIKEWIKPVAPAYARKGGRPRKKT